MSERKCECPTREGLEELFRLLQHLETAAKPIFVLTLSHADRIRGLLHSPCPCEMVASDDPAVDRRVIEKLRAEREDLRAQLAAFKDPQFKRLMADLRERVDESRRLRADLAEALDALKPFEGTRNLDTLRARAVRAKHEATRGER